jgi:hypothetical protein
MTTIGHTIVGNIKQRLLPDHIIRGPLPPLSAYEAHLRDTRSARGRTVFTPGKIRTMVRLRRQHDSWAQIAQVIGMADSRAVRTCWEALPEDLR